MAQLRKAFWKRVRDRIPCSRCGAEHKTREHGKKPKEIVAENKSRVNNPQDNYGKCLTWTHVRIIEPEWPNLADSDKSSPKTTGSFPLAESLRP